MQSRDQLANQNVLSSIGGAERTISIHHFNSPCFNVSLQWFTFNSPEHVDNFLAKH